MRRIAYGLLFTAAAMVISNAALAEVVEIKQMDKEFVQGDEKISKVTVKAGDEIKFINADTTTHQIHDKEGIFEPVVQKPGEETTWKFKEPGEHKVRCAIHPKMKLKVTVE